MCKLCARICLKTRRVIFFFNFYNLSTISYFLRKSNDPSPVAPARRESSFLRSANCRRSSAAVIFKFNVGVVTVEVVEFSAFVAEQSLLFYKQITTQNIFSKFTTVIVVYCYVTISIILKTSRLIC